MTSDEIQQLLDTPDDEEETALKVKWWWHRFHLNPARDKGFWIAVSIAGFMVILASLSSSTYVTNRSRASEEKLTRVETICRADSQKNLDVATGHLILTFGNLANALNNSIPRDSPERAQVDTDLSYWSGQVSKLTDARDKSIVACASLVGRTVPTSIPPPTPTEGSS